MKENKYCCHTMTTWVNLRQSRAKKARCKSICWDLETVIQSEISQKEKNKYRMLTHIYGI